MSTLNISFWHRTISALITFIFLATPLTIAASPAQKVEPPSVPNIQTKPSENQALFRTTVSLRNPLDLQRIEKLGVITLNANENDALLLVTRVQLEELARLQYHPQDTNELELLVLANSRNFLGLSKSLQPLFQNVNARQAEFESIELPDKNDHDDLAKDLRFYLHKLSNEQRTSIANLTGVDDDGDDLTNTEETWWCTDPLNPDSDGDLVDDGQEISQLLTDNRTNGKPFLSWPPSFDLSPF